MSLLEKIQGMKMPFAELKGVKFTEADKDRVVAKMVVRPDLCTLHHTIHGGAVMAFADSVGAAATVINLPVDAKGTTTHREQDQFHRRGEGGNHHHCDRHPGAPGPAYPGMANPAGNRGWQAGCRRNPNPDGALIWGFRVSQNINESLIRFC